MRIPNDNANNTDKTGEIISWVCTVILMFVFPPLGWILLLVKLGVFAKRSNTNKRSSQSQSSNANFSDSYNQTSEKAANNTAGTVFNDRQNQKRRKRLHKKTGKGISVILTIVSIILLIVGGSMTFSAFSDFGGAGGVNLTDLVMGIFYLLGGAMAFFSRNVVRNRFSRYKNYYSFIEGRDIVPIHNLAQVAGTSQKNVLKDLQAMLNNDFLQIGTYIDYELECLVLSPQSAEKMRTSIKNQVADALEPESITEFQYKATLAELREVNSFVADETISAKVKRLEELTAKIFRIVEETPQKQPQIRRFTSYYLPTTLKLVRSYSTLEKQGEKGENIMSAKKSIGDILDTLSTGFEQQLDQLFKSDAIDIAADINVLENLMKQDGLKEDKMFTQTLEG